MQPGSVVDVNRMMQIQEIIAQKKQLLSELEQQLEALQNKRKQTDFVPPINLQASEVAEQIKLVQRDLRLWAASERWATMTMPEVLRRIREMLDDIRKIVRESHNFKPDKAVLTTEIEAVMRRQSTLREDMNGLVQLLDQGMLEKDVLGLYAILYDEPHFAGNGWVIIDDVKEVESLGFNVWAVKVGSGATLFKAANFTDVSQDIYADIPLLMPTAPFQLPWNERLSRLMAFPQSIKLWDADKVAFSGAWAIKRGDLFLSLTGNDELTLTPYVADNELFQIDMVREIIPNKRREVVLQHVEITGDTFRRRAIRVQGHQTLMMTDEGSKRNFSLGVGNQWLTYDSATQRYTLTADMVKRAVFTLDVKIAASESQVGKLDAGEVAVYENRNYWGRAWVINRELSSFTKFKDLNDRVSSMRFGERTGATLFRHSINSNATTDDPVVVSPAALAWLPTALQNQQNALKEDLYTNQPSLSRSQIGDNQLSALRTWQIVDAVPYTCVLSQDYRYENGRLRDFSAYRVTLQLPQNVSTVWVSATDTASIVVNETVYTIDEDHPTAFPAPPMGGLVITLHAQALKAPALRIRTSTMAENSYFLIFPDAAAHKRIVDMPPDALWEARDKHGKPLVNQNRFNRTQIGNAQRAIQAMVRSIRYDTITGMGGRQERRTLSTQHFQNDGLAVNLSISSGGGMAARAGAAVVVPEMQGFKWLSSADVTSAQARINAVPNLKRSTARSLDEFFNEAGSEIEEFFVSTTGEEGKKILQVVISTGKTVGTFLLDTADKVIDFAEKIFRAIGATILRVIEYLQFLFEWDDILATSQMLNRQFNQVLTKIKAAPDWMEDKLHDLLEMLRTLIREKLGALIEQLGDKIPSEVSADSASDFIGEVMDKIFWVFSKLQSLISMPGSSEEDNQNSILQILYDGLKAELEHIADAGSDLYQELSALFETALNDPTNYQGLLAGSLVILDTLLETMLTSLEIILTTIFRVIKAAIEKIHEMLDEKIDVPFFTSLYHDITKQDLTVQNLISLIFAIPVTVATKLMDSSGGASSSARRARDNQREGSEDDGKDDDNNPLKRGFGVTSVVCSIVSGIITTGLDVLPPEAESASGKFTVIMEIAVWLGSLAVVGSSWADLVLSSEIDFKADLSDESWATSLATFEGLLVMIDLVGLGVGVFSGRPSMFRRLRIGGKSQKTVLPARTSGKGSGGVDIGPWIGTGIGAVHLALNIGYMVTMKDPDPFEIIAISASNLPEIAAFCRAEPIIKGSNYLSLVALGALDGVYVLVLIATAKWLCEPVEVIEPPPASI